MLPHHLRIVICIITHAFVVLEHTSAQASAGLGPATVVARYRTARVATMEQDASVAAVDAVLHLLSDSAVYEHPQAGARIVGREGIGAGIRRFLGATRHPRIDVLREIVTGSAVAAEERVTFEVKQGSTWVSTSRKQLTVYFVHGSQITRELQYWAPPEG